MTSRRGPSRVPAQPGPPEHAVRAEEGDVHPGVPGGRDVSPLRRRPVLVVAEGEQRAGPAQQVRVGLDVLAGGVGERHAEALGQLDQLPLVIQEHVGALPVVGPVQADRERAVVVVGDPGGPVVQVVAAPHVVGLPGRHRVLDHGLARGLRRPHGDRDEPLRARFRVHPQQVAALGPVMGGDRRGTDPSAPPPCWLVWSGPACSACGRSRCPTATPSGPGRRGTSPSGTR